MQTRRSLAAYLREINGDDPTTGFTPEPETANEPIIWQYLERQHIAKDISPAEWEAFVEENEAEIADAITRLVRNWWERERECYVTVSSDMTEAEIYDKIFGK